MSKDIDVRDVRAGGEVEIVVRRGVLLIADALADLCSAFRQLADPENYVLTSEQPPTKPKPKPKGTTHDHRNHQPAAALPTA